MTDNTPWWGAPDQPDPGPEDRSDGSSPPDGRPDARLRTAPGWAAGWVRAASCVRAAPGLRAAPRVWRAAPIRAGSRVRGRAGRLWPAGIRAAGIRAAGIRGGGRL